MKLNIREMCHPEMLNISTKHKHNLDKVIKKVNVILSSIYLKTFFSQVTGFYDTCIKTD